MFHEMINKVYKGYRIIVSTSEDGDTEYEIFEKDGKSPIESDGGFDGNEEHALSYAKDKVDELIITKKSKEFYKKGK